MHPNCKKTPRGNFASSVLARLIGTGACTVGPGVPELGRLGSVASMFPMKHIGGFEDLLQPHRLGMIGVKTTNSPGGFSMGGQKQTMVGLYKIGLQ